MCYWCPPCTATVFKYVLTFYAFLLVYRSPEEREAARVWEAALIALLSDGGGRVAQAASAANLTLSFSTER